MKKNIFILSVLVIAVLFTSCKKDEPAVVVPDNAKEVYIQATKSNTWHYFSFAENKVVGTADENKENNAAWAARKDWDIAIKKYHIRTNSGKATTVGSNGGVYIYKTKKDGDSPVYIYDDKIPFSSVKSIPSGTVFNTDKEVTEAGMGGNTITTVKSEAQVTIFKMRLVDEKENKWGMIMPPKYLLAPLCLFRSADGKKVYKVQFTQYINEDDVSGHVKFNFAEIK